MSTIDNNQIDLQSAWKQFETTGKIEDYLIYNGLAGANRQAIDRPELLSDADMREWGDNRSKKNRPQ